MSITEGQLQPEVQQNPTTASRSPMWRLNLQTWIGLLALGLAFWFTIVHARLFVEVAGVLFGALLLTLAIRPIVDTLAHWHIPRGLTVLGVYGGLGGLLVLLGALLSPVVSMEAGHLQKYGPTLLQVALSRLATVPLLGQWLPSTGALAQGLTQRLDMMLGTFVDALAGVGELAVDLLIVLVLAYFSVVDVEMGERLLVGWVPPRYQSHVRLVVARLCQRLTRWVWAQAVIALYFAVVFSTGLAIMRVRFAFIIGLVGGVLEIVPYLGGAVAFALAILSALTIDPWLALWVAGFYVVVVEVESHIVAPALYGRIMGLHPALILVTLLIGARTLGIWGVFFAVPIAVVLTMLLQEMSVTWQQQSAGQSSP